MDPIGSFLPSRVTYELVILEDFCCSGAQRSETK